MTSKANDSKSSPSGATKGSAASGKTDFAPEIPPQVLEPVILILEGLAVWEIKRKGKDMPEEKM